MNPDLFTFILVMLACAIFAVMGYKIGYLYGWDKGMKDCSRIWQRSKSETLAEARRQNALLKDAIAAGQHLEAIQGGKTDRLKD